MQREKMKYQKPVIHLVEVDLVHHVAAASAVSIPGGGPGGGRPMQSKPYNLWEYDDETYDDETAYEDDW